MQQRSKAHHTSASTRRAQVDVLDCRRKHQTSWINRFKNSSNASNKHGKSRLAPGQGKMHRNGDFFFTGTQQPNKQTNKRTAGLTFATCTTPPAALPFYRHAGVGYPSIGAGLDQTPTPTTPWRGGYTTRPIQRTHSCPQSIMYAHASSSTSTSPPSHHHHNNTSCIHPF